MENKPFKILSIDGGGIRGVFPAMFLTDLEAKLKADGKENWQIYQNFDLICGTSTGGIIAIALALGIPAKEIFELYLEKAKDIFGNKRNSISQLFYSSHKRDVLESLIKEIFQDVNNGKDPILKDCKTNICIPVFDLLEGKPSVLKKDHHPRFTRDFHIPAYKAALATAAAPVYFDPYSSEYIDLYGNTKQFKNKVDGGVFANNPTLLGIIEAQVALYQKTENLRVLSLGTGYQKFSDGAHRNKWGITYWINAKRKRIIELFMQAQSQQVEHLVQLLQNGIDKEKKENPNFIYHRINVELDDSLNFEMDETDSEKLKALAQKASYQFHENATRIIETYCL
ncbi:MAG TPA: CBASS cGAMP-activated phospholipase [Bacteroidales bacterium]